MAMPYKPGQVIPYDASGWCSQGMLGGVGVGAANSNYYAQQSQAAWNSVRQKPLTEEELKKQEEERMAREEEQKTIGQQKREKAVKFFVGAISCLGFAATIIAMNCNLTVHDYNTAIVSSVLWGLGLSGLGFTALLAVLGCASLPD